MEVRIAEIIPISLREANRFIEKHHRHSGRVKLYQKINVFSCSHYISCTILVSRWKNTQTFFCAMENRQAEIDKI